MRGIGPRKPLPVVVRRVQALTHYKDCIACGEAIPWEQLTNDNYPLRDDDRVLGPYCELCVLSSATP